MFEGNSSSKLQPDFPSILKEASCGKARLINIFGDSFTAALAVLAARARRFWRNRHLDINLPRMLIVITFFAVGWFMLKSTRHPAVISTTADHSGRQQSINGGGGFLDYDLAKDVGTLFGATITILFAMTNMHREYHYKKREKSSHYITLWHSDEYVKIRSVVNNLKDQLFWDKHPTQFDPTIFNLCHSVVAEYKKNADGIELLQHVQSNILWKLYTDSKEGKEFKSAVDALLSFSEHMGQDVKDHVADSDYLKDYFYSIVIDNYELFRKYIEYVQIDRSSRITYCNIVYLAQIWEKEGCLPELPRICIRPPVITSEDLQRTYDLRKHVK